MIFDKNDYYRVLQGNDRVCIGVDYDTLKFLCEVQYNFNDFSIDNSDFRTLIALGAMYCRGTYNACVAINPDISVKTLKKLYENDADFRIYNFSKLFSFDVAYHIDHDWAKDVIGRYKFFIKCLLNLDFKSKFNVLNRDYFSEIFMGAFKCTFARSIGALDRWLSKSKYDATKFTLYKRKSVSNFKSSVLYAIEVLSDIMSHEPNRENTHLVKCLVFFLTFSYGAMISKHGSDIFGLEYYNYNDGDSILDYGIGDFLFKEIIGDNKYDYPHSSFDAIIRDRAVFNTMYKYLFGVTYDELFSDVSNGYGSNGFVAVSAFFGGYYMWDVLLPSFKKDKAYMDSYMRTMLK